VKKLKQGRVSKREGQEVVQFKRSVLKPAIPLFFGSPTAFCRGMAERASKKTSGNGEIQLPKKQRITNFRSSKRSKENYFPRRRKLPITQKKNQKLNRHKKGRGRKNSEPNHTRHSVNIPIVKENAQQRARRGLFAIPKRPRNQDLYSH